MLPVPAGLFLLLLATAAAVNEQRVIEIGDSVVLHGHFDWCSGYPGIIKTYHVDEGTVLAFFGVEVELAGRTGPEVIDNFKQSLPSDSSVGDELNLKLEVLESAEEFEKRLIELNERAQSVCECFGEKPRSRQPDIDRLLRELEWERTA